MLHIVFAVEQAGIDRSTAAVEQTPAEFGEGGVAHGAGHLLGGAERAEVPDAAQRIGSEELDVIGVVLDTFHDAVAVRVPAARNPGELQGAFCAGPEAAEPGIVARELPVEVQLHDLAHLAVGGGGGSGIVAGGQQLAELHQTVVVKAGAEGGLAARA